MNQPSALWIFIHVPKCAGSTVGHHLRSHLAPDEFLPLSFRQLGPRRASEGAFFDADDAARFAASMDPEAKARLRVVAGHLAFHGIERFFGRPARYAVFLREPLSRTVSHYRFLRDRLLSGGSLTPALRESIADAAGAPRPLADWLGRGGLPDDYMTCFLTRPVFEAAPGVRGDAARARAAVDGCSFVGFTETFDRDFARLCESLGIPSSYETRNASEAAAAPGSPERALFEARNRGDLELYRHALRRRGSEAIAPSHGAS